MPDPGAGLGGGEPCEDWTSVEEVQTCPPGDKLDAGAIGLQIPVASEIMFKLSGKRYPGMCTAVRSICLPCIGCDNAPCTCTPRARFRLPGRYPSWEATRVTIDGVDLDPAAYKVWNRRDLVRLDGNPWPRCVDLSVPEAFEVEWVYGRDVPPGGRNAATKLTAEMAAACSDADIACQLPQHITQVVREGVTYTIIDSMKMLDEMRTGLYEVDLWLAADKIGKSSPAGGIDPAARMVGLET